MSVLRLFAVIGIFVAVSIAWMLLGGSVLVRTKALDDRTQSAMNSLWGPRLLEQDHPYWTAAPSGSAGPRRYPSSSRIRADIRHDHRYKGLLWYNTFTVDFDGRYTAAAPAEGESSGHFVFPLPGNVNGFDRLAVTVDGRPWQPPIDQLSGELRIPLEPGKTHEVAVGYTTRGQDVWLYAPRAVHAGGFDRREDQPWEVTSAGVVPAPLEDFELTVTTDFEAIDYPAGTRSPSSPAESAGDGRRASWQFANALTNQPMGVVMPSRANAGPIVMRMSFFAPVSLLFFLTALFAVVVLRKVPLHPMHTLFIACGFFAFHILLAYTADLINIQLAFWICAAVSVALVVSYMRLVAGMRFAVVYVGLAQLVFLVGFSYAFFWTGKTGLMISIGAVLTLFVLMQATGRVNWHAAFARRPAKRFKWDANALPTAVPVESEPARP